MPDRSHPNVYWPVVGEAKRIRTATYYGQDLVARPRRLALMNLFLHGVEAKIYIGDTIYEPFIGERYDIILTNPPFGTKEQTKACLRDAHGRRHPLSKSSSAFFTSSNWARSRSL